MDLFSYATYGFDETGTNIIPFQSTAEHYWNYSAHLTQSAWKLTSKIGIQFPCQHPSVYVRSIIYPMRRLVMTGEETAENLAILFGPTWQTDTSMVYRVCRLLFMMDPEPGSVPWNVAKILDERDISTVRLNPREPIAAERLDLIQAQQYSSRRVTSPSATLVSPQIIPRDERNRFENEQIEAWMLTGP